MKRKKVIVSVTNDLLSDQRVDRTCIALFEIGFDVLLVGRKLSRDVLSDRLYKTHRFALFFNRGPLFYAEYNFRLFIYLLFHKFDIAFSNDLDTLSANFLASKLKNKALVYDSHELFTEVPELQQRGITRNIWLYIEKLLLPKVKYSFTVCESIANYYSAKYKIQMKVLRNVPLRKKIIEDSNLFDLNINQNNINSTRIIIYQGALNVGRGIELLIDSMQFLDNTIFIIAGDGDISEDIKAYVKSKLLSDKVLFTGRLPFEKLHSLTCKSHLGISLEENMGKSYYYSLPNKIFDYIQAGVPVLVSDLPEMRSLVEKLHVGEIAESRSPDKLALQINRMLQSSSEWKDHLKIAAEELCWENEKKILVDIFNKL